MATIPDSVKAQLDADWTGAGGAEPSYYVEEDFRTNPPLGEDAVWILSSTLDTDPVPFNDKFTNEKHVLELIVNTLTSEDRLKELGDEVVRILNATTITDMTYQRLKRRKILSGVVKGVFNYQEQIIYDLREQMKSSAAAYGSGATGDFTITGDLTVGGDDIKDSSSAVVISFDGAGNIDNIATITASLDLDENIQLDVGKKIIFDADADSNNYWHAVIEDQLNLVIEGVEIQRCRGSSTQFLQKIWMSANIESVGNKTVDIGVTGTVFDDIYADDFVNESPYQKFDDALSALKKIKDKKDKDGKDKIDYESIPDWVRRTEYKWKEKEDPETGEMIRVNKIGKKTELNLRGWSVNRMVVFLWQALQEALTRIEVLEQE